MGKNGDISQSAYAYSADIYENLHLEHTYACGSWMSTPLSEHQNSVLIYPNPSNGNTLTIKTDACIVTKVNIVLTDETGRIMYAGFKIPNGNSIELDNLKLKNGIYFISVANDKTIFARSKLLVTREK